MVHFPALPSPPYEFRWRYDGITRRGLPHSEIPGSKVVCTSPRLIAAYCVLHRLLAPRHSPYALSSLTIGITADDHLSRVDRHPTAALPTPSLEHCVFLWIRKNYRLQDIQLSKIRRGASLPEPLYWLTRGDPFGPAPFARAARYRSPPGFVHAPFGAPRTLISRVLRYRTLKAIWPVRSPSLPACLPSRLRLAAPTRLPSRSSRSAKRRRAKDGGEYRARTGDLLVANQALSQLS